MSINDAHFIGTPVGGTGVLTPPVTITGTNPASVPLTIVGAPAQLSDYFDISASGGPAGGVLKVDSSSNLTIGGSFITSGTNTGFTGTGASAGTFIPDGATSDFIDANTHDLVIRGAGSQAVRIGSFSSVGQHSVLALGNAGNPSNGFQMVAVASTLAPILSVISNTDTNQLMQLNGLGNRGVGTQGTGTNDNAVAGNDGEFISSAATAVSLTTGTSANAGSISLTPGDWDVDTVCAFTLTGATVTAIDIGPSSTSATFAGGGAFTATVQNLVTTTGTQIQTGPRVRFSLAVTTTIFMVVQANFSAGTVATTVANGLIRARRVR